MKNEETIEMFGLPRSLPLGFVGGRLLAIALIIMLTGIVPFWQNSTKR